jgi:hypothetical protein
MPMAKQSTHQVELSDEEYQTLRAARAVHMGIDSYVKEKGLNAHDQIINIMLGQPVKPRWNFFQWVLAIITFIFTIVYLISLGGNH